MKEYYVVEIGYNGAGGDVAKSFTLDKESGFVKIIGSGKTLSLTLANNTLPILKVSNCHCHSVAI